MEQWRRRPLPGKGIFATIRAFPSCIKDGRRGRVVKDGRPLGGLAVGSAARGTGQNAARGKPMCALTYANEESRVSLRWSHARKTRLADVHSFSPAVTGEGKLIERDRKEAIPSRPDQEPGKAYTMLC